MTTAIGILILVLAFIGGDRVIDWIVSFFKNRKKKSSK